MYKILLILFIMIFLTNCTKDKTIKDISIQSIQEKKMYYLNSPVKWIMDDLEYLMGEPFLQNYYRGDDYDFLSSVYYFYDSTICNVILKLKLKELKYNQNYYYRYKSRLETFFSDIKEEIFKKEKLNDYTIININIDEFREHIEDIRNQGDTKFADLLQNKLDSTIKDCYPNNK